MAGQGQLLHQHRGARLRDPLRRLVHHPGESSGSSESSSESRFPSHGIRVILCIHNARSPTTCGTSPRSAIWVTASESSGSSESSESRRPSRQLRETPATSGTSPRQSEPRHPSRPSHPIHGVRARYPSVCVCVCRARTVAVYIIQGVGLGPVIGAADAVFWVIYIYNIIYTIFYICRGRTRTSRACSGCRGACRWCSLATSSSAATWCAIIGLW